MKINILQISEDSENIEISVETRDGDTIQSIVLWNDETFKDYSKAINLDSYLKKTNNKEVFIVPLCELNITTLGKIFFIEVVSTDLTEIESCNECASNITLGVTADLSPYKEFILDLILNLHYDKNCEKSVGQVNKIINLEMILTSICTSIQFGFYNEAISLIKDIIKLTTSQLGCDSCSGLTYAVTKTSLGFGIMNNNLILK